VDLDADPDPDLTLHFDADLDPDPACYLKADLDQAGRTNANPCGFGSGSLSDFVGTKSWILS
jgi:hypothetical protein